MNSSLVRFVQNICQKIIIVMVCMETVGNGQKGIGCFNDCDIIID